MSKENKDPNDKSPEQVKNRQIGQSHDAVRHEKDALHHKFHRGPQRGGADEKNDQGSQAKAQRDGVDMSEGQSEIPKVGSRDAPGG